MTADVRMAEVAALVGDPARANTLGALMGGRALTAGELMHATGVSPQTTSGHLGKLAESRLITCVKQGRHRYYRIATPKVAEMLEGIMAVVADTPARYRPASKLDDAMRAARTSTTISPAGSAFGSATHSASADILLLPMTAAR